MEPTPDQQPPDSNSKTYLNFRYASSNRSTDEFEINMEDDNGQRFVTAFNGRFGRLLFNYDLIRKMARLGILLEALMEKHSSTWSPEERKDVASAVIAAKLWTEHRTAERDENVNLRRERDALRTLAMRIANNEFTAPPVAFAQAVLAAFAQLRATPVKKPSGATSWKDVSHSVSLGESGDSDYYVEITNGALSLFAKDQDDGSIEALVKVLNEYELNLYVDDADTYLSYHFEQAYHAAEKRIQDLSTERNSYRHLIQQIADRVFDRAPEAAAIALLEQFPKEPDESPLK